MIALFDLKGPQSCENKQCGWLTIFIVGSCDLSHRTKVCFASVPSLRLLFGFRSRSRLHTSFTIC